MTPQQLREFKAKCKEYLRHIAAINPSTASSFWSEAIDEVLTGLPYEVEDQAVWSAILLGWRIDEFSEEAAAKEVFQTTLPEHRREVQKVALKSIMNVYRTAIMIPSINLRKALPVALGRDLMQFATNDSIPIESSMEALRFLTRIAKTTEMKSVIQSALDETMLSHQTDHFSYVLNKSVLWASDLGYGVWAGMNLPPGASGLYSSVNLLGMRDFKNAAWQGDEGQ